MIRLSFSFPQISRLFSAMILWVCLIALLLVNFSSRKPFNPLLMTPFVAQAHVAEALSLWNQGWRTEAIKEILLAKDLEMSTSVLGASIDTTALLADWTAEPGKLEDGYRRWKTVTIEKPDYADGYFFTGIYAYQLGNKQEATEYIQKARTLNPTAISYQKFLSLP